jgi:hypothetical protein
LSVHAASKMMWEAGRMNVVVAEYDRRGWKNLEEYRI